MSNLHIWWGQLLVDALAQAGVRHGVLSPGSRSTPLALALARHPRLRTTVVVDERCAAFVALGQARVTGRPSLVVCTSGTAGAHFLPAVMEASQACLPLLLLTADRPPELHERGALQTVRQENLFGGFVRQNMSLGVPEAHPAALAGVRSTAALAVQATLDPRPGPVHLNAAFRKPLEPQPTQPGEEELRGQVERLLATSVTAAAAPRRQAAPELVEALAAACAQASRGVILAGPGPVAQATVRDHVAALAWRLGFPVVAEAGSQLRFAPRSPAPVPLTLLAGEKTPPFDLALVVGAWPTSAGWSALLESSQAPRPWVVCEHGWIDPSNRAGGLVVGEVGGTLAAVRERLGRGQPRDPSWYQRWQAAAAYLSDLLRVAEEEECRLGKLSETTAVRVVVDTLPEGCWLALGNSLTIREVDGVCGSRGVELKVLTQRGVSGIDGGVSGAAGAALAAGEPVVLITGDLAFQHDVGGLATAAGVATPLVIVVLNNRGGRLFEQLPLVESGVSPEEMERFFVTPQRLDIGHAASTFGVASRQAATPAELAMGIREALTHRGCTVVQAMISQDSARQRWQALKAAAQAGWR